MSKEDIAEARKRLKIQVDSWPHKSGLPEPTEREIEFLLFGRWMRETGRLTDYTPELLEYYKREAA